MSLRLTSAATLLTITVGVTLAAAPAAAAAPPLPLPVITVARSALLSQGFTCTATRCTKPGTSIVWTCGGTVCTARI